MGSFRQGMEEKNTDMPITLKARLNDLARRLPEGKRGQFVRNVVAKVGDIAKEHPRTVVYGVFGWVLGSLLDNVLTFGIPFSETAWQLTGDRASHVGILVGTTLGFLDDRKDLAVARTIHNCMRQEWRRLADARPL